MVNVAELKNAIETLLKNAASKANIPNFEPIFNIDEAIRGEGFTGEFFLASIKNKDTNEVIEVAIKRGVQDSRNRDMPIRQLFQNEAYFYTTVFPTLNQFQIEKSLKDPFVDVGKFYCSNLEEGQEALLFENLKSKGYVIRDLKKLLDDEHTTHIFNTYGKYHALSFALKDQNFEKYQQMVKGFWSNMFDVICTKESMKTLLESLLNEIYELLDSEEDAKLKEIIGKIKQNPAEKILQTTKLQSDYKTIVHGDCWSNNMMFKYSDSGKLESMKLIDFQIICEANPVQDLSYFFYAGASKEQFDKLDEFLKIYHDSLSKTLRELGSDPEKLYSFEQLKKDWAKHGLYGLIFGLMVTKVKLMEQSDIMECVNGKVEEGNMFNGMINASVNKGTFKERVINILSNGLQYNVI